MGLFQKRGSLFNYFLSTFIFIFWLSLTGCPAPKIDGSVAGTDYTVGGDATGESGSSGSTSSDGDSGGGDETTTTTDTEALPQASLPTPSLQGLTNGLVIASAADSAGTGAVPGYDNAVDASLALTDANGDGSDDSYEVVASTEPVTITTAGIRGSGIGDRGGWLARIWKWFLRIPNPDSRNPIISNAYAEGETAATICDSGAAGIGCCDIKVANRSFECFVPGVTNGETVYIYVMAKDGSAISPAVVDTFNEHHLYVRSAPEDISVATTTSGGSSSTIGAWTLVPDLRDNSGTIGIGILDGAVYGLFTDYFANWDLGGTTYPTATGEQIAYDSTYGYFGVRNDTAGIYLEEFDGSTATYACLTTDSDASEYTVVKQSSDNQMRYGIQQTALNRNDYVRSAYDGSVAPDGSTCDLDPRSVNRIQFLASGDVDSRGAQMYSYKVLTFDVDNYSLYNTTIVAFQSDTSGTTRLRMANPYVRSGIRTGGETPLSGNHDFRDLVIYKSQNGFTSSSANSGRFLMVDYLNNLAWFENYYVDASSSSSHVFLSSLNAATEAVTTGIGPESVTFNTDKSIAFIQNSDNTATVLPIQSGTIAYSVPVINSAKSTINLSDSVPGKTVTLASHGIKYYASGSSKYLLVGLRGTKAVLKIDVTGIESSVSTAAQNAYASEQAAAAAAAAAEASATAAGSGTVVVSGSGTSGVSTGGVTVSTGTETGNGATAVTVGH